MTPKKEAKRTRRPLAETEKFKSEMYDADIPEKVQTVRMTETGTQECGITVVEMLQNHGEPLNP